MPAVIRELEVFKKSTPDLQPGDRGGAFVRLKTDLDLKRGVVSPNFQTRLIFLYQRSPVIYLVCYLRRRDGLRHQIELIGLYPISKSAHSGHSSTNYLSVLLTSLLLNVIYLLQTVLNGRGDFPDEEYRLSKSWEIVVRPLPGEEILYFGGLGHFEWS